MKKIKFDGRIIKQGSSATIVVPKVTMLKHRLRLGQFVEVELRID